MTYSTLSLGPGGPFCTPTSARLNTYSIHPRSTSPQSAALKIVRQPAGPVSKSRGRLPCWDAPTEIVSKGFAWNRSSFSRTPEISSFSRSISPGDRKSMSWASPGSLGRAVDVGGRGIELPCYCKAGTQILSFAACEELDRSNNASSGVGDIVIL